MGAHLRTLARNQPAPGIHQELHRGLQAETELPACLKLPLDQPVEGPDTTVVA